MGLFITSFLSLCSRELSVFAQEVNNSLHSGKWEFVLFVIIKFHFSLQGGKYACLPVHVHIHNCRMVRTPIYNHQTDCPLAFVWFVISKLSEVLKLLHQYVLSMVKYHFAFMK